MDKFTPLVFICCPITPRSLSMNHAMEHTENLRHSLCWAGHLMRLGMIPFCPAIGFLIALVCPDRPTDEMFYETDLELIGKCDALLIVGNVYDSPNCMKEIAQAGLKGVPVFGTMAALIEWRNKKNRGKDVGDGQ